MTSYISVLAHDSFPVPPPHTKQVEHADNYHGVVVADPYRWLEQNVRTSEEVQGWIHSQNAYTESFLSQIPQRPLIKKQLTSLWNYEKFSAPERRGDYYYYHYNGGLQNQPVLMRQLGLHGSPDILIDPNTWSEDGTLALAGTVLSRDGRYLAFAVQQAGSDWRTWKVMDLNHRQVLDDELHWIKFNTPVWAADGQGLYYARYPEPNPQATFQTQNKNQQVYYHRLGTPQDADILIHARPDFPDWSFRLDVTEDGRFLIITSWKGTDRKYRIDYKILDDLKESSQYFLGDFDAEYTFITDEGDEWFFLTNLNSPYRRVIAVNRSSPQRQREVIPEKQETLLSVKRVGNRLVAHYLRDATSLIAIYSLAGERICEVTGPSLGSVSQISGERTDSEFFFSFTNFVIPGGIYRYSLETQSLEVWKQSELPTLLDHVIVSQVFYTSRDGTRVPMFLAHRSDIKKDGRLPTLMYGYGGFNIPLLPGYTPQRALWLAWGGVFAMPNLRGGGEYGEAWHQAGTKQFKQNVFDDFISAAEWLISHGWTVPERLAIHGGSNGGLLVGGLHHTTSRTLRCSSTSCRSVRHAKVPPLHSRSFLGR